MAWVLWLGVMLTNQRSNPNDQETQSANRSGVHVLVLADRVDAGGLARLVFTHSLLTMSNGVSIKDLTAEWQRKPKPVFSPFAEDEQPTIQQLAMSESHPSGIPDYVFAAHEEAKRKIRQHGSATAEITFNPDAGAFELVAETRDAMDALRALGAGAKITIHY